jgi:ribosome-binding factor A
MDQIRRQRLEELIREEISYMISRGEIKDHRVNTFLSITRVEASHDGSHAKVWVSRIEEDDSSLEEAIAGLAHAAGFIQAVLSKRVRLRLTPILTFLPDQGIKESFKISEKLKDLLR